MKDSKIRVLLVDDHQVLLDGLKLLLRNVPDIVVVGVAQNGHSLLEKLATDPHQADLILMDIEMPGMDGIEATTQVKIKYPHLKVIMLTMKEDFSAIEDALARGADGFISKNNGQKSIIAAIRKVYNNGELVIQANLSKPKTPISKNFSKTRKSSKNIRLTEREKRIITLLYRKKDTAQIAETLSLSIPSLITHLKVLFSKLGVNTSEDALQEVVRQQLIAPTDLNNL